jgi:NAD(P)-dependent dehydrogenase (short-subunit alcohol dehydrogenase family)
LVTGAGSGIGLAIAQRFAEEGARVAIVGQDMDRGCAAARQTGADFLQADVSSEDDVRKAVQETVQRFRGIDHLVNNAGIVLVKPVDETTLEEWDRVMNVNVRSVFLTAKYCLPFLRRAQSPTIVTIGSVSSFVGQKHTPACVPKAPSPCSRRRWRWILPNTASA